MIPSVADQVNASTSGNVTGASATILGLTTLFFALGIAAAGISVAAQGLRSAGLIGM
ncbi:MAG: hypothetical protein JSW08_00455 [archaeon]|nr:MAG: hypothetical protein JSW08_00455 [archaeon]